MHKYICISDNVYEMKYIPQTIYCKGLNKKYIYTDIPINNYIIPILNSLGDSA